MLFSLVACAEPGADGPALCTSASLASFTPADGAIDVAADATLELALDGEASEVELWVDGGTTGPPVALGAGSSFSWTPAEPLAYDATYTAVVSTCGQEAGRASFTVESGPVRVDLVNRTYIGEFAGDDVEWVHPSQDVSEDLLGFEGGSGVLLMLTDRAGDTATALVAIGEEAAGETAQYDCITPVEVAGVDLSADPYFVLGPTTLVLSVGDDVVTLYDVAITGRFALDGGAIEDLDVAGSFDLRLLGNFTPEQICAFASKMGTECRLCPDQADGEEPACVLVEAIDHHAPLDDSLVIDPDLPIGQGC